MAPDDEPKAYELAQKARGPEGEGLGARAGLHRRAGPALHRAKAEDRAARDRAYADAMRALARRYPGRPRRGHALRGGAHGPAALGLLDGATARPTPETPEIVATLERVLARNPNHPGANHLYIHAVEATAARRRRRPRPTGC